MNRGIFITGTGTDVGKTIVSTAILHGLLLQGLDAVPMKPVQTGGYTQNAKLCAPDLEYALKACNLSPDEQQKSSMAPYVFEPACSPHLAARTTDAQPDIKHIIECADALWKSHEVLIVEGAGGIMVPLNEEHTMLELMQALDLPVLVVCLPGLGTINHTLLSIMALRNAGLEVAGVIFNATEPTEDDEITRDNPKAVSCFGQVKVLGQIDFQQSLRKNKSVDWTKILQNIDGFPDIVSCILDSDNNK